tara:strand:+ start:819 stop:1814 length:996 start_codon:yes stop_codon:yes gene_type:complete
MIVKNFELKSKKIKDYKFYLLYGNNKGLIEETIKNQFKKNLPKNVFNYEESEVLKDIDQFKENLLNKSFFENEKLIIISRVSEKILKIVDEIIQKDLKDIFIVLSTESLDKKSKLRTFFEKNSNIVCVPFYDDNHQTLSLIAQSFFKEKGINLSQQNINFIIDRARGDRLNLKNELEKIELFSKNKKRIEIDEILKLTNLAENFSITELVDNALAGNEKKTLNIINENNFDTDECILILRTFLSKLKRLLKIKEEINKSNNVDKALSSFKPPIFWKDKEILKKQINVWDNEKILKMIVKINNIELQIKKNPLISVIVITNYITEQSTAFNN